MVISLLPFLVKVMAKNVADIYNLPNKGNLEIGKDAEYCSC